MGRARRNGPQVSAPLTFEAYRQNTDPALEMIVAYGDAAKPNK
jgi:hypothetical protein